jgi:hypothetical protein
MPVSSVVKNHAQERVVDLEREFTVVLDESEFLEFVQKEIHA